MTVNRVGAAWFFLRLRLQPKRAASAYQQHRAFYCMGSLILKFQELICMCRRERNESELQNLRLNLDEARSDNCVVLQVRISRFLGLDQGLNKFIAEYCVPKNKHFFRRISVGTPGTETYRYEFQLPIKDLKRFYLFYSNKKTQIN